MILFTVFGILAAHAIAQTCYMPDGTPNSADYQPCNKGKVSMCCATNRTDGALNECESNGLCLETGTSSSPGDNRVWREGCTDPTWKDPACLHLCTQGFVKNQDTDNFLVNETTTHIIITTCADGSFCCGGNNTACCNANAGAFIINGKVVNASTSTTSLSTSTPTISSSPAPSTSSSSSSSLGIGLGVGLGVGAVLLLALGAFLIIRKRRRTAGRVADGNIVEKRSEGTENPQYSELPAATGYDDPSKVGAFANHGNNRYSELAPTYTELPSERH